MNLFVPGKDSAKLCTDISNSPAQSILEAKRAWPPITRKTYPTRPDTSVRQFKLLNLPRPFVTPRDVRLPATDRYGWPHGAEYEALLPLDRFERLLLKAIQHYNLFTNKKRLRTFDQRKANINLTPAALWDDTQEQRKGDARRKLTPREVFERFIPWQSRICRRGLVNFMSMRYSSDELVEQFNEHARQPGKRDPLPVRVKRLDGRAHILLWQKPDGTTAVLDLVEEDARSIGSVTWKGLEFLIADDSTREVSLKPRRRASRDRVTSKAHASVVRADNARAENEMDGLEGATAKAARLNAEAKRDARRGAAQAAAYGIASEEVTVSRSDKPSMGAESSYLQRLAKRLMGQKPAQEKPQHR